MNKRPGAQCKCRSGPAAAAKRDADGRGGRGGGSGGSGRGPRWLCGAVAHSLVAGNDPLRSPRGSSLLSSPGRGVRRGGQKQDPLADSRRKAHRHLL